MSVLRLTEDSFHQTVSESECLVVAFGAASVLEESSRRHSDTVFGRVDARAHPELAALFGLGEGPALLIFREKQLDRISEVWGVSVQSDAASTGEDEES